MKYLRGTTCSAMTVNMRRIRTYCMALRSRRRTGFAIPDFIFIPAVLLVGVVVGWILGSRAARDAYAMELKRREERAAKGSSR